MVTAMGPVHSHSVAAILADLVHEPTLAASVSGAVCSAVAAGVALPPTHGGPASGAASAQLLPLAPTEYSTGAHHHRGFARGAARRRAGNACAAPPL